MQTTRKELHNLLVTTIMTASTDPTRDLLGGVHLELFEDGIRAVSTDGHRITIAESGKVDETVTATGWLPLKAAKELAKSIKPCKRSERDHEVYVTIGADERVTVEDPEGGSRTLGGNRPQPFPPWRMVVPEKREGEGTSLIGVNPMYLAEAGKALTTFVGKDRAAHAGCVWSVGSETLDPIRVDAESYEGSRITIVIMPVRID